MVASRFPVVVYTNFGALVSILKNDDMCERIAGWQAKMVEYDIDPRHTKIKNMGIADRLACMPYNFMNSAWPVAKDWEDMMVLQQHQVPNHHVHDVRGDSESKEGSMQAARRGDGENKRSGGHNVKRGNGESQIGGVHDVRRRGDVKNSVKKVRRIGDMKSGMHDVQMGDIKKGKHDV